MECKTCKIEMKKVNFGTGIAAIMPYLWYKKKGILELEKRSSVSCYVCVECGKIEFIADEPQVFKNI
ncbi:MAG: hypothetical protein KH369_13665 [Paraclostridium bifermentans]|uniref:hypothetical protein n=1 Tax=Paraclostridium bifermentans TaxID=1490 RepID=UPI0011DDB51E|nr:hypothetical protein [Paraclostridium bifermentans]MBS6509245.1 hypothetical protein [Paraclostridium bifermentans]MCU9807344.1 hypothetical protein [Paraclostridium sp. AKS46]